MYSDLDCDMMLRVFELAQRGLGKVQPNPLVGCVIVCQDKIIGEGYHMQYGGPHAEVNAIESVEDKSLLEHATLYVNLEPCAHHGKTPPCAELLVKHKIKRVVISNRDSFAKVDGKGIALLKEHGIQVQVGLFEQHGRYINRRFFTFHEKKRPFVIAKWAETADGYIASLKDGSAQQISISNNYSKAYSHLFRVQESAIMVGTTTAEIDDPKLTARLFEGNQPLRIVLDRTLRLSKKLHLFSDDFPTLVFHEKNRAHPPQKNKTYKPIDFKQNITAQILTCLYEMNVQSLIVEGGTRLIETFFKEKCVDELRIFQSAVLLAHSLGVKAPDIQSLTTELKQRKEIENDVFFVLKVVH